MDNNQSESITIIGTMIGIVLLLILFIIIINASNNFTYKGLKFKREKYGDLFLYSTNIPTQNALRQITGYVSVDFRNDPRDLRNISIDIRNREIRFLKNKIVYLSVDPLTEDCEDGGIAIVSLGLFLNNAKLDVKLSSIEENHAERENIPYITCNNTLNNTVITVRKGNETKITEIQNNCYEISFENCESILDATEVFELEIISDYMSKI